ncbi:hypothetical protein QJQ45_023513 [Haematococcus lacustris]|nr:hypothetical protein QJQ45_023513 [Haematococcus lacustris]
MTGRPERHQVLVTRSDGSVFDLRYARLQLKYGQRWIRKKQAEAGEEQCSAQFLILKHDSGLADTVLEGHEMQLLAPGAFLFANMPTLVDSIPPAFPNNCFFMPGRNQDCTVSSIRLPTQQPEQAQVPAPGHHRWLRGKFHKLRDPNFSEVHIKVNWRMHLPGRMQYLLLGKYAAWKRSSMLVFKSKKAYGPGDQLELGGPGLADMTDLQYIAAFRHEPVWDASEAVAPSLMHDSFVPQEPIGQGDREAYPAPDFPSWFTRFAKAVKRNRVADVRFMIDTGKRATAAAGLSCSAVPGPYLQSLGPVYDVKSAVTASCQSHGCAPDTVELERGDQSFLLQPEVSYAPPNEQEVLVVDLAVRASNLEMLCLLVHLGRCSLSYKALKYLVHHWEDCPVAYTTTLNILLTYLLRHPGPLAVVSAVMTALRAEMRQRHKRKPTAALEEALAAFQQLQVVQEASSTPPGPCPTAWLPCTCLSAAQHLCLAKLQEILRKFGADDQELMPRMEAILDPPRLGPSLLISEMRPLRMAFDDSDATFMNAPLVASYLQKIWMGKEYVLETCKDGRRALSSLDPSFGFAILLNLGFCPPSAVTLEYAMRLWHLCCLSQRVGPRTGNNHTAEVLSSCLGWTTDLHRHPLQAFYNSPRARWAVRFLGSILYFVAFLQASASALPRTTQWAWLCGDCTNRVGGQTTNSILFLVCIAGNALEALVVLLTRYHLDAIRFMKREPLQMLYLGVDVLMLFLTTSYVLRINHRMDAMDDGLFTRLTFVWAAMGPLVTGRLLLVMVPLLERLGPLLNTVQSMLLDLATFALPWLFLTAGFAVSLQVVFSNAHNEEYAPIERLSIFNSFWETMFFLFRGFTDKFDYTLFEEVPSREARVYGQAILAIYFTLCGLLLANLLIAIITHRYRPEDTKEQNALNMAQIIDNHQHQASRPVGRQAFRRAAGGRAAGRRSIVKESFTPASPRFPTVATGGAAVPHLLFLLCLLPLIWATALALVLVHAPLCILYFAAKGHQKFLVEVDELLGTGPRSGKRRSWGRVSQGGEAPWESSPNASSSAPAQRQDRSAAGASTFGTAAISRRRSGSNRCVGGTARGPIPSENLKLAMPAILPQVVGSSAQLRAATLTVAAVAAGVLHSGIMDASELSHVPGHDAGRQPFRLASLLTAEGLWAAAQQVPRFLLFLLIGEDQQVRVLGGVVEANAVPGHTDNEGSWS